MQQPVLAEPNASRFAVNQLSLVASPCKKQSDDATRSQALILADTFYSQTLLTLTTGVFLSGFCLALGASHKMIGLLMAIPHLAQLLQLPGIYLVQKWQSKRGLTLWGTLGSRLCLLPLVVIGLLPQKSMAMALLVVCYLLSASVGAVATCAWNSWVREVIPCRMLGSFFSRKLSLAVMINLLLTLGGGAFLNRWIHTLHWSALGSYGVLYGMGLLIGFSGVLPLRHMAEPQAGMNMEANAVRNNESLEKPPVSFAWRKFLEPFQELNYRRMIRFLFLWNFAMNLAVPLFTVYMLSAVGASMGMVTWLIIIGQLANFLMLKTWGRLIDRFSNKSVLMICIPGILLCMVAWAIFPPLLKAPCLWPVLMAFQVLFGISQAGTMLAGNNLALKLSPDGTGSNQAGTATACIANSAMTTSLATGLAPLLGGLLVDVFHHWHWQLAFPEGTHGVFSFWSILFGVACVIGLVSLVLLGRLEEPGHVRKRVIVQALLKGHFARENC